MRADWTASGARTSGSIAPPADATRRTASGGAETTSTAGAERRERGCPHGFRASFPARLRRRFVAALRRQRRNDDHVVRVHVDDGRNADARRLDDVDGVDADG